jgi:hypothetical protein
VEDKIKSLHFLCLQVDITYYLLKVKMIALFEQPSAHSPHRMHSLCFILPLVTMVCTSRLIGHFLVQSPQLTQLEGIGFKCKEGILSKLPSFVPRTMKGAIQQME